MDEYGKENVAASPAVRIRKNAKRERTQASVDLPVRPGKLFNQADMSDLVLACKDGVRMEACRVFLAGRSPVMDKMLKNGIFENNSSVISLPKVRAPVLLAVLEFLYTGKIVHYRPEDWRTGLKIITAEHFCLLPAADKIVEEHIMEQIQSVCKDVQQAAVMLSVALSFKCVSHDKDATCLQLLRLLKSEWMHPDNAGFLSEGAIDFVLRHTKRKVKCEDGFDASLEEYFRFRGVLVWCMDNTHSRSAEEVDKLINMAIPIDREKLYGKGVKDLSSMEVEWLPKYAGDRAQDEILQCLRTHGTFESAIRLLAHIDWVRIPPAIFMKIVERMKFVPEFQILDIFRFHSLHRVLPMRLKLRWVHADMYRYSVSNGGLTIQKRGDDPGAAICELKNRVSEDSCIWRFIVHEVNRSFCQLGFVCSEGPEDPRDIPWYLEEDILETTLDSISPMAARVVDWSSRPAEISFDERGFEQCGRYREPYKVASTGEMEFHFRRSTGSCAIKVDGKNLGTVWTGLPTTGVFPAVCLPYIPKQKVQARIHLEIVSGFEIF